MKRLVLLLLLAAVEAQAFRGVPTLPGPGGGGGGGIIGVKALSFTPVRPTAIAANTNDYSPGAGNLFYITASSTYNITGVVAAADGFVECFANVGSNAITFKHRSASSAAANRLNNGLGDASGDVVVGANQAICYTYDLTNTRWQMTNTSSPSGFAVLSGSTFTGTLTTTTAATGIAAQNNMTIVPAATGVPLSITGLAASSAAETWVQIQSSDSTASGLTLWQQSATAARSLPSVWGYTATSATESGLSLAGLVLAANDSGAVPAVTINGTRGTAFTTASARLTTRSPVGFYNFDLLMGDFTPGGTFRPLLNGSQANCADSGGDAACTAAFTGRVVVDAADTTTVVSTTAVTAASEIRVWDCEYLGTALSVTCNTAQLVFPDVSAISAGSSFTITTYAFATGSATAPGTNPECVCFEIRN